MSHVPCTSNNVEINTQCRGTNLEKWSDEGVKTIFLKIDMMVG